jgi:hypothetical protein
MTGAAVAVVAAILVQMALAHALLWRLGQVRLPLVFAGQIRPRDVALSRDPWPDRAKQVSNAFDNQFQLPVLFYVSAGLALYFGPNLVEAVLAWLFVVSRLAHALIHATSNHMTRRFSAFIVGFAILGIFWVELAVHLVLAATHPVAA